MINLLLPPTQNLLQEVVVEVTVVDTMEEVIMEEEEVIQLIKSRV